MSFLANSIGFTGKHIASSRGGDSPERKGLLACLIDRIGRRPVRQARLTMVERICLAPRQTLSLVEADGHKFLVATSPEGTPVFYPLNFPARHRSRHRSLKVTFREEQA